jgi:dTDP-4-amino-4,6-dideoxygalactose transaminase
MMYKEQKPRELAIFGGSPAFEEKLHVGRPNIGDRQALMGRIEQVLDSRWLTNNGRQVQEFEREIAKLLGVKHCIAVCNATVGLEIAIKATELQGEVIVPAFTFVATAHALRWQGLTPVFCDVDPETHTIDPARVEELITPRTTGIMGVHLWGRSCNVEALTSIAREHNLNLLFDAAHAFGCSHGGRMIGNFGDAEVFSFHATKFLNTLEGGAITTNDDELMAKIRLMKNFGFAGQDNVIYVGTNGKMNELSAAMGLTSLENMDEFIAVNRSNYDCYRQSLESVPGVRLMEYDKAERCNHQYVVLEIDEAVTQLTRDELVKILWAENVVARRYFYPGCHRMEPYRSSQAHIDWESRLPETIALSERLIILPTGTAVGPEQIERICGILRTAIRYGTKVKRWLGEHEMEITGAGTEKDSLEDR